MEVMCNNYIPGDSRLIEKLVSELKSQGIFDQFRKECISDVDTKPAYQNLRQRVEGSVTAFLKTQTWSIDLNKNQLREQLRKNLYESGFLETGVERIVDQVVNPKINTVFLPKVEEVVYKFLGVDKPVRNVKKEVDVSITDLLPTDLEAVSPESVHSFKTGSKKDNDILNSSLPSSTKMEEDESPPFEPIDENNLVHSEKMIVDENTRDSHLSGFSGLESHDSNPGSSDNRCYQMELSNQDSQGSQISSESHLSIVTSEDATKMEVCEDSNVTTNVEKSEEVMENETEIKIKSDNIEMKNEESKQAENKNNEIEKDAEKKFDKGEDRKSRTSEKYSKDKKDDKQRKSSSSSKDKSSSKSSSQSKNKESRDKDRKDSKSCSSKDKDRDKTKDKEKSDKEKSSKKSDKEKYKNDKERSDKDKARSDKSKLEKETANKIEKEKTEKERSKDRSDKNKLEKDRSKSDTDKSKLEKDKSNREKDKSTKDKSREKSDKSLKTKEKSDKTSKDKSHRDRSSSSKDTKETKDKTKEESKEKNKSSSSSSKHGSSKEKKPSTPKKESSSQSKDKSSSSGSAGDSKSKTPTEKSKKDEPTDKYSINKKDKQKDSKKKSKDDHYSSKLNKTDRRSTDRDSNDGQSSKNYSNSYSESSRSENNSQDYTSSTSFTGGSGDSSNSDQIVVANSEENSTSEEVVIAETVAEVPKVKYMKPKFALNFEEARKIMKIRKQLAILEKQNKLSLAKIELPLPLENGIKKKTITINKMEDNQKLDISEEKENIETSKQDKETTSQENPRDSLVSTIESTDLSKENWEALEAKLAQVMAEVNCNSYESDEDFEFHGYSSVDVTPKHLIDLSMDLVKKTEMEMLNKQITNQNNKENVGDFPNTNETKSKSSSSSPKVQVVGEENVTANGNKTKNGMAGHTSRICRQLSVVLNKTARDTNEDACYYLDKPTESEELGLRYIQELISKLDEEVDCTVQYSRENALQNKGKKRKLEEAVDVKNNNKTTYMETVKKRTVSASFQSVKAVANKKRMCSTDITPTEVFPLPLSPAESDKSNERKDEDLLIPIKQKRIVRGYSQRYSSEDLYKPRPTIGGRRSKLARGNV